MSQYQTSSSVTGASTLIEYVTIAGKLIPISNEDYVKLARLAWSFRRAVQVATRMVVKGMDSNDVLKELRRILNKAYADSAFKLAKAIVKGCITNGGNTLHVEIRKLFIISEGESDRCGNRNVRLEDTALVKVRYPYDGSWIILRAEFGEEYLSLLRELVELARQKRASYNAGIAFRDGGIYIRISVPIQLYLKHFKKGDALGELVAGFDVNSDRVNLAIIDKYGRLVDVRAEWFPEATSPGFPREKARELRVRALAKLLRYCYTHGVGTVVFENLYDVRKRRFTKSKTANRKISRFAKRELLHYAIVMSLKYGFKVLLADPKGTTSSAEHGRFMMKHGLDRHTASAYLIALRGLAHQIIK